MFNDVQKSSLKNILGLCLVLVLIGLLVIQNNSKKAKHVNILRDSICKLDSINISQRNQIQKLNDSIVKVYQFVDSTNLSFQDFEARFKVAKVKRYISICERKPSNKVYFYGWIKRAVEDVTLDTIP